MAGFETWILTLARAIGQVSAKRETLQERRDGRKDHRPRPAFRCGRDPPSIDAARLRVEAEKGREIARLTLQALADRCVLRLEYTPRPRHQESSRRQHRWHTFARRLLRLPARRPATPDEYLSRDRRPGGRKPGYASIL